MNKRNLIIGGVAVLVGLGVVGALASPEGQQGMQDGLAGVPPVPPTAEVTLEPTVAPATATPLPAVSPFVVEGEGIANSKKFDLPAGDYKVVIDINGDGYCGATLEGPGLTLEMLVNEIDAYHGETYVYDVEGGSYYIDASCGNSWAFTFSPAE